MRKSIQTHSLNGSTGKIAASSILVNRRGALLKYSPSMFVLALALLLVPACASNSDPIPAPASVSDEESGLAGLVTSIEEVLPSSPASAAMVFVDDSGATYAFAGDPGTDRSTGFEFASVTKVMTAVLIADLAGEGLIDLDASFSSYFTGDDLSRAWDTVTARSLLTHSAGMPAFPPNLNPALLWLSGRAGDPFRGYTRDRLSEGIRRTRPGGTERWRYSNYGYAVLGYLAELQTGSSYGLLMEERIFAPAGMNSAAVDRWVPGEVAVPLDRRGRPSNEFRFDAMAPAGAVRGSIEDAAAFLSAALRASSSVESPEGLARALRESYVSQRGESDWPYDMGLGWIRSLRGDDVIIWHNGGTAGASSFLGFAPEARAGLAILTNVGGLREIDGLALDFLTYILTERKDPGLQ
jgi:D-alanyl-D-alanine-carboxypeptidase/D-alanyl-D-alanine-endopeptidase